MPNAGSAIASRLPLACSAPAAVNVLYLLFRCLQSTSAFASHQSRHRSRAARGQKLLGLDMEAEPEGIPVAFVAHDGVLVWRSRVGGARTGDGLCKVFGSARAALDGAVDGQRRVGLSVRMGIATRATGTCQAP